MAILDTIKKIKPLVKTATGYIHLMLSSQSVSMDNGNTLQEEIDEINNNLIHEYTTNDNCKCIRFKNINLQICFGTFTATASLNANGDWYTGSSSSITNGSFAQPFAKIYSTQITQGASDWVALLRTDISYSGISQITLGYNHSYSNTKFSFNYVVYGAYL